MRMSGAQGRRKSRIVVSGTAGASGLNDSCNLVLKMVWQRLPGAPEMLFGLVFVPPEDSSLLR